MCWKYIVRMLGSAHKYGLRIHFDMHTIPGSHRLQPLWDSRKGQRPQRHHGRRGRAARAVLHRIVVEFIPQPEYIDGIPMFRIMNGAL
ncbi:hypothetical protein B0H11DRAFT_2013047, partial [Mycena galericulata]